MDNLLITTGVPTPTVKDPEQGGEGSRSSPNERTVSVRVPMNPGY